MKYLTEAASVFCFDEVKWNLLNPLKNPSINNHSVMQNGLTPNLNYAQCPTGYRTRHIFNNFTTNEGIAKKFEADLPHCA
jgi:hypothetical protein